MQFFMDNPQLSIIHQVFTHSGYQPAAAGSRDHAKLSVDPIEFNRCLRLNHLGKEAFSDIVFPRGFQFLLPDLEMTQSGREQFRGPIFSIISRRQPVIAVGLSFQRHFKTPPRKLQQLLAKLLHAPSHDTSPQQYVNIKWLTPFHFPNRFCRLRIQKSP